MQRRTILFGSWVLIIAGLAGLVAYLGQSGTPNVAKPEASSTVAGSAIRSSIADNSPLSGLGSQTGTPGAVEALNESALNISTGDVDLLVVDPIGRRTGFDSALGASRYDIPGSLFWKDDIGLGTSSIIDIDKPEEGNYKVILRGRGLGLTWLSVGGNARDGSAQPFVKMPAITAVNSTSFFTIHYGLAPGAALQGFREATFETTLADIKNGLELHYIDSQDVAAFLSEEINRAAAGDKAGTRNILRGFADELKLQSGQMSSIQASILMEDAASLLRQYSE